MCLFLAAESFAVAGHRSAIRTSALWTGLGRRCLVWGAPLESFLAIEHDH